MRQIINQILEGNFGFENGSLDFSYAKIDITLQKGAVCEGSFTISAAPGHPAAGTVTSSDMRMECLTREFTGMSEEILYRFHARDLEEGDVVRGQFHVVSSQGEYYLPFTVSVEHMILSSSIGSIKNLFHFANLAKTNWDEAVNLFYSPDFHRILSGNDSKHYDSYRGLSLYPGNEQNVEEFLIAVNKKQKVEYLAEESVLTLENPIAVSEMLLTIVRNGWGYTRLHIYIEGGFAFTEKEILTDDDFLGNSCILPVYVDSEALHRGRNFGRLTLYNSYVSLSVPIVVKVGDGIGAGSPWRERKRLLVQLMEFYQAFRLKKIGSSTWLKETGRLVDSMVALNEKDIAARLFQAQLLITQERLSEAEWLLNHAGEILRKKGNGHEEPVLYAYWLYLTTLTNRKEAYVDQVAAQVEQVYKRNRTSWQVAWLLLFLSQEYSRKASARWSFLEKQFTRGCTSPVIYVEALIMLNHNPALLRRLGDFEMQVLTCGARQEMLGGELVEQLLYLAGRVREYSPCLYRILAACYQKSPDVRILQEICTLLIKGGLAGHKYFKWYKLGVESELRITKLYEYYMMSVDMEGRETLPRLVLMYFSYQNNLDYEHSAFLYHYVLKHREEYEELYAVYQEKMERFIMEQIQKEHINRHLAGLYQALLTPQMIGPQTATALSRLLFAHQIRIESPGIRNIIVYQPGNERESVYPAAGTASWAALYGNDYTILLEDGEDGRFVSSVPYTTERLLLPGRFVRLVSPYVKDNLAFNLYLFENGSQSYEISEDDAERGIWLSGSGDVRLAVKQDICLKVLKYYFDHDDMRHLDDYLDRIPVEELTNTQRRVVLQYLVLRGKYETAYEWVCRFAPYFADVKTLVRLISVIIEQEEFVDSDILTASAIYVFRRGKYDGNILRYLTMHFEGMTREMRDIWKAAVSFDVDCYGLCEKMIVQMLYTGSYVGEKMEIFSYYISRGAKTEVEEAFLTQCAYDYFVKEKLTENTIFEEIFLMHQRNETVQKVCRLAYLKYYSENRKEITDANRPVLRYFLRQMLREGIHLNFFREFEEFDNLLYPIADKTIIEYCAHPEAQAIMHYVVLYEDGEAGEYRTEEMTPVYGGVFFKEFVLFFGETLQYYIVERKDGEEELTRSGSIQKSDMGTGPGSRFDLVNDIVISKTMQDYDTLDCLLEEYCRKEYFNRNLFILR